jgi:hypothetical protein
VQAQFCTLNSIIGPTLTEGCMLSPIQETPGAFCRYERQTSSRHRGVRQQSRLFTCQISLICSTRFSALRTPRVHLDMQTWRRIYLDAQTRSLLGVVDCSSIERPHSNPAPFANVKIHGLTLPCENERIKSGRKCAQRRLKHFHDQRGIMTYVRM